MVYSHYKKIDYVRLVISKLKTEKSIKFSIPTASCPDRSKKCRKRHGNYEILEYNPKNDMFKVRSFPVHSNRGSNTWLSSEKLEKNFFMYCLDKRKFTVRDILKRVDMSNIFKTRQYRIRLTDGEYQQVANNAKKYGCGVADFIRARVLQ